MNNKFCFIALFLSITVCACSVQKKQQKDDWLNGYKREVFISCVKSNEPGILKNDISQSINLEVIGNTIYIKEADNLGAKYNKLIQPSKILDYDGKKSLVNSCLEYYGSKELDDMARSAYQNYLKSKKQK